MTCLPSDERPARSACSPRHAASALSGVEAGRRHFELQPRGDAREQSAERFEVRVVPPVGLRARDGLDGHAFLQALLGEVGEDGLRESLDHSEPVGAFGTGTRLLLSARLRARGDCTQCSRRG